MTGHTPPPGPEKNLTQRLDIDFALQAAGMGVWELDPVTHVVNWDEQARRIVGLNADHALSYEEAANLIHPDDVNQVGEAVRRAMSAPSEPTFDLTFRIIRSSDSQLRWVHFLGRSYFSDTGEVYRFAGVVQDVTGQVVVRRKIEESEARFRTLIQQAPAAMVVVQGEDLVIETINQAMLAIMGREENIIGKPLEVAMPELVGQDLPARCRQVFRTGIPYYGWGDEALVQREGRLETGYYNVAYTPFYEGEIITGVMQVATDVTEQVLARRTIEASEARIRSLVESAPFPIGVYVGREMRIQLANQSILDIWGKGNEVIGKRYSDILPELENQAIFTQLDGVFTTGIPFHANDQRVDLLVNGQMKSYYFNYSFTPLYDADGQIYGVMNTAADVTNLALAKRQVEETEASLRGAIELAELGTWEVDAVTGQVSYSDRIKSWFGFMEDTQRLDTVFIPLHEKDRSRVEAAIQRALQPGGSGQYEEEYTLVNAQTGAGRVVHAQGITTFDAQGNPVRIRGTAQDVTKQRELQRELEQQVQERTEELAAANEELASANEELASANEELASTNEELAANNEEYAAINEELLLANQDTAKVNDELMESTSLLMRSNENLQRFAYVASHDLQEPLRKIQQFGDLLRNRYGDPLGEGVDYLERMQSAATRMSTLIRDLLDFSRIATQRDSNQAVSLTDLVGGVLADLELTIQETGAEVAVDPLPEVFGDASQLKQLFQNLLSNALKFRRPGTPPRVQVLSDWVRAEELPYNVRPARSAPAYHRIDVVDNGIGFDEKYLDRIFQVFQRLHGKSEYAGTGIGLAICEKVVTNHGGAITASSQPGQGATFRIYLPNTLG